MAYKKYDRPRDIEPGYRSGLWTVIEPPVIVKEPGTKARRYVRCKCDCGTVRDVDLYSIVHNKTKSCGCMSGDLKRAEIRRRICLEANKRSHDGYQSRFGRLTDKYPNNDLMCIEAIIQFNVNQYLYFYKRWKLGSPKPLAVSETEYFFLRGSYEPLTGMDGKAGLDTLRRRAEELYGKR